MFYGFGRRVGLAHRYNIVPLDTIRRYVTLDGTLVHAWPINLLGNIGVFVPFGFLIPLATGWRWWRSLSAFVLGVLVLEMLQLVTKRGSFDVDDVLLNAIGFAIGYILYESAVWLARLSMPKKTS